MLAQCCSAVLGVDVELSSMLELGDCVETYEFLSWAKWGVGERLRRARFNVTPAGIFRLGTVEQSGVAIALWLRFVKIAARSVAGSRSAQFAGMTT